MLPVLSFSSRLCDMYVAKWELYLGKGQGEGKHGGLFGHGSVICGDSESSFIMITGMIRVMMIMT